MPQAKKQSRSSNGKTKKAEREHTPEIPRELKFDYLKSPLYRSIHVDGAFGGIGPRPRMAISFYAERSPIPKQITHPLNRETGALEDEDKDKRVVRDAIIREVEFTAYMDLDTAKSLADWIMKKVSKFEKDIKSMTEGNK
jgi:hypothetical protein